MRSNGWNVRTLVLAFGLAASLFGCGSGSPVDADLAAIFFETTSVPAGGAGQFYNAVVRFGTEGGATLPDQFNLVQGTLPPGLRLFPDREDNDFDGLPDEDGARTGHARILGFPREVGSFSFTLKGIATRGELPALAAQQRFAINVNQGSVAILSPTAAEGTSDPAVPAFPDVIAFVNPANPSAFFSFAWEIAGGSNDNLLNVYVPRELELSVFDASVVADKDLIDFDVSEGGDKFDNDFSDGGLFVLQAGDNKVQVGGFQSPRGPVGRITRHADGPGLDPDWFQPAPGAGGASQLPGDPTLGTPLPVVFSDYADPAYRHTHPGSQPRAKYPFTADQYENAFFVPFVSGVDLTPLKFRVIVEAIDTRGTTTDRTDDVVARKAYIVKVQIPDIVIDTVVLAGGTAGVDYNEFINASGGVPPLQFELEHVDGAPADGLATPIAPGDLDKQTFGMEIDRDTGRFFGVPRASGTVDLTVRVFASVMNPTQDGDTPVPTGSAGELDGRHPITGLPGRHRTLPVVIAPPLPLSLVNTSLVPGVDGFAYPGDRLTGVGGVARLVPYPPGFTGTYPAATALRNYSWEASYIRDASHGAGAGSRDPDRMLPNNLQLDGVATSVTNGSISGTTLDRGFHPVTVQQTDCFVGDAAAPATANATVVFTTITLSVSPDTAIYMRGCPAPGGEPSGLLDASSQIGEPRMVPLFMAAGLYTVDSGLAPVQSTCVPCKADILPVMIVNGDNDEHVRKSIPSVSGFWPAEAGTEGNYSDTQTRAWGHLQQELTWLQVPNATQRRVFLWGETTIKKWSSSAASGGHSKRYQQYDPTGRRGILVLDPLTGDFWTVANLSNDTSAVNGHGSQFGAEIVMMRFNDAAAGDAGLGYWKFRDRMPEHSLWDREVLAAGLGSYIEAHDSTTSSTLGWNRAPQGRNAISVAMSADGAWCATALPGGSDEQKILVWKTDKSSLTQFDGLAHVTLVDGCDRAGNTLAKTAAIFRVGGANFKQDGGGNFANPADMRRLNADSLMFVDGGLVFTQSENGDRILGICLGTGSLTTRRINSGVTDVGSGGTRSFSAAVLADRGMYIPDQDYLRLLAGQCAFSAQFAFAGNEPAAGALGPDRLAFIAGETRTFAYFPDDTAAPVDGKHQQGNRNMSLMFLEINSGACLDLSTAVLKDLTGSDNRIHGDLLTPGRTGEELDFVAVSPNGKYVAVVRDYLVGPGSSTDESVSSFTARVPTFATPSSSVGFWGASDDLLLISTGGDDMDSSTAATEHVLFLGTRVDTATSTNPAVPSYARSRAIFNASQRRINGLVFSETGRTLFVNYAGSSRPTKYFGSTNGWAINPEAATSSTFAFGTQMIARLDFRTAADAAINFTGTSSWAVNALQGIGSGITALGPTAPSFGDTDGSDQQFWSTFKSPDGRFLYYVSDQMGNGRTFLVGLNITAAEINGRKTFEPFSPHAATVGLSQIDVNAFNYASRFAAVPAGTILPATGRHGGGIVCVVASDASAGALSATDLDVYAFDANNGGTLINLSAGVTDGTLNAINHLYLSTDGNIVVFQRSKTGSSTNSRTVLTGTSDLMAVTNLHAVLFSGATPKAVVVSANKSHGASVALVGEGTVTGPQAVVFSAADAGGNTTWDDRTLRAALLVDNPSPDVLDATQSHYAVLAGARRLNDEFDTAK